MITRFSSRRQHLDRTFLADRLKGAQFYDRIAGYFSSSQIENHRIGGEKRCRVVSLKTCQFQRCSRWSSCDMHLAAEGCVNRILSAEIFSWPRLPETGNGNMDKAAIDSPHLFVPESDRLEEARLKAFYQYIRFLQRPAKSESSLTAFQVRGRLDWTAAGRKVRRSGGCVCPIPDAGNASAQVRQKIRAQAAHGFCEVQNADSFQQSFRPSLHRGIRWRTCRRPRI